MKVLWRWSEGDGGRRKKLGAISLNSAHRRHVRDGRRSCRLGRRYPEAAALVSKQPYSGTALLALEGEAPIKGGVNKARPNPQSDCLTAGSGSSI